MEQRRHALSVLNPGGTITYAHLDRAVDLAVRYELNLALVSDWRRAAACSATRTIETPPIYDDAELALFAHELGHLENPVSRADRASLEGATACERVTACP